MQKAVCSCFLGAEEWAEAVTCIVSLAKGQSNLRGMKGAQKMQ